MLESLGEIIAVRELQAVYGSALDNIVKVLIGKPEPLAEKAGYYCPFQIIGIGAEDIKYAVGVDAVQALQLVMIMIGATLDFRDKEAGGILRWEGRSTGDFGFPTQ